MTERDWQCLRKVRHNSPEEAAAAIPKLRFPELRPMTVYHCPHCKMWHVGRVHKLRQASGGS